ncbi:4a-hydroxytetrahydrobiopterin dehydratase [Synechococcus sp. J7-Johnson]|uniref:4a-hydroxytetrahydrobiopterin dehydratase n=1 Tax=Synechococcus sp. J7-Johnson TaxID=2823737 RepID=UPI0020CF7060|nr:4a-hydroxytetrahydrobiopterin dehydratase [Synechococcus sp. J7-Johnson]MCP9840227.1 4a-hydroxytetrahydrobiopterin dehydratase [Synechococcus sp. J7-Johnson]
MEQPWTPRPKPEQAERLERRIEFADYASNRAFLDRLNDLCVQQGRYPDISFGRTYVNITLRSDGDDSPITSADHAFAAAIDDLLA